MAGNGLFCDHCIQPFATFTFMSTADTSRSKVEAVIFLVNLLNDARSQGSLMLFISLASSLTSTVGVLLSRLEMPLGG